MKRSTLSRFFAFLINAAVLFFFSTWPTYAIRIARKNERAKFIHVLQMIDTVNSDVSRDFYFRETSRLRCKVLRK